MTLVRTKGRRGGVGEEEEERMNDGLEAACSLADANAAGWRLSAGRQAEQQLSAAPRLSGPARVAVRRL
eukprot:scaffold18403_cov99-Isochrysis_galbana.AAC.4